MKNILLSGVGGQGTVLASKMIAGCAVNRGETAHTAETIGMAQRGGCVVSHVRIGDNVYSPLIPHGTADLIIAFEPAEAVRTLSYLKKGGTVIVSSLAVKPATDALSSESYTSDTMISFLQSCNVKTVIVDSAAICDAMHSAKFLNMALLGAASAYDESGFTKSELEAVISDTLKPQFREANMRALELGIQNSTEIKAGM